MPYDMPDPFRQAARSGLTLTYSVTATLGGALIAAGLAPLPGSTITDTTKSGVRRQLNLSLAPEPELFDKLSPIGTRLSVACTVEYANKVTARLPMGVFEVDKESVQEGGGQVSVTAPDLWGRVQRARFVQPRQSVTSLMVVEQITTLVQDVVPDAQVIVTASSRAMTPLLTWEKDRDKAIADLAASIGAWGSFDRSGRFVIADVPTIGRSADWLVDASASGVLVELDRERSRSDTRNVVVVESSATEDADVFPTQIVWDDDPASPTYAGVDPVLYPGTAGPFGIVTHFYDTPLALGELGARAAGRTILARSAGLASQVSLGMVPNPAVDAFDVIDVLPPQERAGGTRVLERHIADTVTTPLAVSNSAQTIQGRSTRTEEFNG